MGVTTYKTLLYPTAMSSTLTTNIYNNSSALLYSILRQIHIANKTTGAVTFSCWLGATGTNAAGTEWPATGHSIPANSEYDWFGALKMLSTDFLVGGASAATSLTITITGEIYAV